MSEARALTSTISNAVSCIVLSIWENACDREAFQRELGIDYARTEEMLDEDAAGIPVAPAVQGHMSVLQ